MSLQSIKSNYIKFLQVLKDKGMTLNESQKETLDGFMGSIEDTISQTRDDAIRTTKRLVEEKMEKEFKTVFESILTHKQEHQEISEKIQSMVKESKETEPLVEAIDRYLDKYVEQILPKKTIVDYERLEKLERIQESLKDLLQTKETVTEEKKEVVDTEKEETPKTEEEKDGENEQITEEKKEEEDAPYGKCKKCGEPLHQSAEGDVYCSKCMEKGDKVKESKEEPKKEEIKENCECVKTVDQEIKKVLEDGEEEKKEETPIETTTQETAENEENAEECGEKNLEEALKDILEGEKVASDKKENCSKDVDGTEITPDTAEDSVVTEEYDEDEPRSVQVTNETMQMWIDAINRTTPIK